MADTTSTMSPVTRRRRTFVIAVLILVVGTVVARQLGYEIGTNTFVRCRRGHLFTTVWIPGVSVKAVRLGWARYQYCPVGGHWGLVTPVKGSGLTDDERRLALESHDLRVP
jgi:hypothetical protein